MLRQRFIEHVYDRAFGNGPAGATLNRTGKQSLQPCEIDNFCAYLLQMVCRNVANFRAASLAGSAEIKDRPHFLRREAEVARTADESEGAYMPLIIDAVSAFSPRRRGKDADPLKVADRFNVHAGSAGQFTARDAPTSLTSGGHDDFP